MCASSSSSCPSPARSWYHPILPRLASCDNTLTAGAVQDVDISKVKKEDLDFSSNLSLEVSRDDYCHALVAYFTAEFSKSHTKLGFCTGTLDWRELCSAARVLTRCFCCCCACCPRSQYTAPEADRVLLGRPHRLQEGDVCCATPHLTGSVAEPPGALSKLARSNLAAGDVSVQKLGQCVGHPAVSPPITRAAFRASLPR